MFAYCGNNPVNYIDPAGENASEISAWWLSVFGSIASVEPTVAGEIILLVGLVVIGTYSVVENIFDSAYKSSSFDKADSATDSDSNSRVDDNGRPVVEPGQQPTEQDGYQAPKGGPQKGKTSDGKIGWKDKNGNIWVPAPTGSPSAHGGGHWDVQSPKGGYTNVYPGGMTRGGQLPYPKLPVFP